MLIFMNVLMFYAVFKTLLLFVFLHKTKHLVCCKFHINTPVCVEIVLSSWTEFVIVVSNWTEFVIVLSNWTEFVIVLSSWTEMLTDFDYTAGSNTNTLIIHTFTLQRPVWHWYRHRRRSRWFILSRRGPRNTVPMCKWKMGRCLGTMPDYGIRYIRVLLPRRFDFYYITFYLA
jgi:hypothetical protein